MTQLPKTCKCAYLQLIITKLGIINFTKCKILNGV